MDLKFMEQAFSISMAGLGNVSPNPCVGAVLVKDGKVISTGFHGEFGGPHAEVVALKDTNANDCDLYVTLEPCCHFGKTPPCTDLVIKSGVKRVICAMIDPFSSVKGNGLALLADAGIEVIVLDYDLHIVREVRRLNQYYLKGFIHGLPFVTLKAGLSLDGRIALNSGESKWITGEIARKDARLERGFCDAVLVGSGTVSADDPELSGSSAKQPLRVIIDRKLSLDPSLNVFRDDNVFVATTTGASADRCEFFDSKNIEYKVFGDDIDVIALLKFLFEKGIRSIFVEGGSRIHGLFLESLNNGSPVVDRILFYYAPLFLGCEGVPVADFLGAEDLSKSFKFDDVSTVAFGSDTRIECFSELL